MQNLVLPAGKAVSVDCAGTGKYLTLAVPGNLSLCDVYVQGYQATWQPSPSPSPSPTVTPTTPEGCAGRVAAALLQQSSCWRCEP
jgi:hypothetical protein